MMPQPSGPNRLQGNVSRYLDRVDSGVFTYVANEDCAKNGAAMRVPSWLNGEDPSARMPPKLSFMASRQYVGRAARQLGQRPQDAPLSTT